MLSTEQERLYQAGIAAFNAGDYFDAHEHWEDLWNCCESSERRFFQGLIHATVAVYHACNGNLPGAVRLFGSGRKYMSQFPPYHHRLDVPAFWSALAVAFAPLLAETPDVSRFEVAAVPAIQLESSAGFIPDHA